MPYVRKLNLTKGYSSPADVIIDKIGKEALDTYDTVVLSSEVYEKMKNDSNWEIEDGVWLREFGFFSGAYRPETCFRIEEKKGEILIAWLDYGILNFFEFPAKKREKEIFIDV